MPAGLGLVQLARHSEQPCADTVGLCLPRAGFGISFGRLYVRGNVSEDTQETLSPTTGVPGRNPHDGALSMVGVGGALVGSVPVSPGSPAPPTLSSSQAWA